MGLAGGLDSHDILSGAHNINEILERTIKILGEFLIVPGSLNQFDEKGTLDFIMSRSPTEEIRHEPVNTSKRVDKDVHEIWILEDWDVLGEGGQEVGTRSFRYDSFKEVLADVSAELLTLFLVKTIPKGVQVEEHVSIVVAKQFHLHSGKIIDDILSVGFHKSRDLTQERDQVALNGLLVNAISSSILKVSIDPLGVLLFATILNNPCHERDTVAGLMTSLLPQSLAKNFVSNVGVPQKRLVIKSDTLETLEFVAEDSRAGLDDLAEDLGASCQAEDAGEDEGLNVHEDGCWPWPLEPTTL